MSKTILIVDDSGSFRMVIKVGLERAGYQVIEAVNGRLACELLDGRAIDLIVSDLNMPDMDGLAFVHHLRNSPYQHTPVVMLTTVSQIEKQAEAQALGLSAWISKPFQPSQLIDTVRQLCPL
ncbi:MAG: response regulator [Burkholderiales bacterium]|nr:response regulator [Burkholderiales bacterium]